MQTRGLSIFINKCNLFEKCSQILSGNKSNMNYTVSGHMKYWEWWLFRVVLDECIFMNILPYSLKSSRTIVSIDFLGGVIFPILLGMASVLDNCRNVSEHTWAPDNIWMLFFHYPCGNDHPNRLEWVSEVTKEKYSWKQETCFLWSL